ncbi:hypothetical protein C0Q70_09276 [Pomacea canaliculata]|uniref:Uncharacterized protein n=1 Tax=Pomacea canaliculata TaxID=400727 RepID=A0A2T7P9C0_POMCA|nr:hypothetical protein C0Q70_09276 [Pomacea canaliculata]
MHYSLGELGLLHGGVTNHVANVTSHEAGVTRHSTRDQITRVSEDVRTPYLIIFIVKADRRDGQHLHPPSNGI